MLLCQSGELDNSFSSYIKDIWRAAMTNLLHLIWLFINDIIFEGTNFNSYNLKATLLSFINEAASLSTCCMRNTISNLHIIDRLGVATIPRSSPNIQKCKWVLLCTNEMKLNCDGSAIGNPGKAGLGVITRYHARVVLRVMNKGLGIISNYEAECSAILDYLVWALSRSWNQIWVETDSAAACHAFASVNVPWIRRTSWYKTKDHFTSLRF
ncbi:hypothetical protein GIB67_007006 [Kingdonia uniflora]|uniref:RNase H type-1 domain-containing protein n=1 Tax=Kingdonia uniflora TaxID=39325 RepID=A0A7J7NZH2_9MAGN|nr:hypothetical protein GIB67_007006 [Kingdonia uniflora]